MTRVGKDNQMQVCREQLLEKQLQTNLKKLHFLTWRNYYAIYDSDAGGGIYRNILKKGGGGDFRNVRKNCRMFLGQSNWFSSARGTPTNFKDPDLPKISAYQEKSMEKVGHNGVYRNYWERFDQKIAFLSAHSAVTIIMC